MSEILKTKDYSMFRKHESNRELDKANLKKLTFSIQTNNMLSFRPILVDENMFVIDGQHRLEAAKILGVEIYYQINRETKSEDIILLNANQKRWTSDDYINYYRSKGNQNYIRLYNFCKQKGITPSEAFILAGRGDGKFHSKVVKLGTFDFDKSLNMESLETIISQKEEVKQQIIRFCFDAGKFVHSQKFGRALCGFLRQDEMKIEILMNRIMTKAAAIKPCASVTDYYEMLRNIYNWRNPNPID